MAAQSVDEYVAALAEDRREALQKLRALLKKKLPKGFVECISYGMIGYVVPHKAYPKGYHCDPDLPLPFLSIASQKNHLAVYHMGLYADAALMEWFVNEYPKHSPKKLDMGKSCIRFKHGSEIPMDLLGELATKMSVDDWIVCYERAFRS